MSYDPADRRFSIGVNGKSKTGRIICLPQQLLQVSYSPDFKRGVAQLEPESPAAGAYLDFLGFVNAVVRGGSINIIHYGPRSTKRAQLDKDGDGLVLVLGKERLPFATKEEVIQEILRRVAKAEKVPPTTNA